MLAFNQCGIFFGVDAGNNLKAPLHDQLSHLAWPSNGYGTPRKISLERDKSVEDD